MRTIAVLFLMYFVIYSASPLACSTETDRETGTAQKEIVQARLCLYLVDLVLSGLSDNNSAGGQDDQSDDDHFLIRKKRAVLSSSKPRLDGSSVALEKVLDYHVLCSPVIGYIGHQHDLHPAQDPAFLLFSGKAPPAA